MISTDENSVNFFTKYREVLEEIAEKEIEVPFSDNFIQTENTILQTDQLCQFAEASVHGV